MRLGPPEHGFVAYIDEAGDPGLQRVRPIDEVGGTEWFVVSAVLVDQEKDHLAPTWVKSMVSELALQSQIIHFAKLSPTRKLAVSRMLSQLPVRIFVVASNKKNMRRHKNEKAERFHTKQWFYNWMARILLERVTDYCFRRAERHNLQRRHVKFVFSQSGGHSYSQTAAYHELLKSQARSDRMVLTKWVPRQEVMDWKLVENFPHYMRAGLQLADIAASAFYAAADKLDTGPCCAEYAMAIYDKIAMNRFGTRCDYGVVLQPTPDWKINITEDQKQIFRFYGYDFQEKW